MVLDETIGRRGHAGGRHRPAAILIRFPARMGRDRRRVGHGFRDDGASAFGSDDEGATKVVTLKINGGGVTTSDDGQQGDHA